MPQVKHRVEGAVGIIELDNPPHQFMTLQMVGELDELTERWEGDPSVRAIVITGTKPGTFITHFSVEELAEATKNLPTGGVPGPVKAAVSGLLRGIDRGQRLLGHAPALRRSIESGMRRTPLHGMLDVLAIHRVFSRLECMDKAVIAAINGTAMGGGCELTLACDYRLMARGDNVIGLIEVLAAIIPGAGGTQRLARTVGQARAVEMLLDGVLLGPDVAERVGLVTRAVDAHELMGEAMALARRMATRPLAAVGHAKRAVRVGASLPIDDGLAFEQLAFIMAGMCADANIARDYYLDAFRSGRSAREIFGRLRSGDGPTFQGT
jgi:enoyl-CoA hydratase/carnithine racemase